MNTLSFKTAYSKNETVKHHWHIIDAEGLVAGRLASQVAHLLMGKHRTDFAPHMDCGDNVIVVNASKVRFTGKKMDDKVYLTYSGYPGVKNQPLQGRCWQNIRQELLKWP